MDKCNNCNVELTTCQDCGAPACHAEICGGEVGVCLAETTACIGNKRRTQVREMREWVSRFFESPSYDIAEILRGQARRVVKLTCLEQGPANHRRV